MSILMYTLSAVGELISKVLPKPIGIAKAPLTGLTAVAEKSDCKTKPAPRLKEAWLRIPLEDHVPFPTTVSRLFCLTLPTDPPEPLVAESYSIHLAVSIVEPEKLSEKSASAKDEFTTKKRQIKAINNAENFLNISTC